MTIAASVAAPDHDWMSVGSDHVEADPEVEVWKQGLCSMCAVALWGNFGPGPKAFFEEYREGQIPRREHWISAEEYKRAWHDNEYRRELLDARRFLYSTREEQAAWEEQWAERLHEWPRCEDCPEFDGGWGFRPEVRGDQAPIPPFCGDCHRKANLTAEMEFPWLDVPIVGAGEWSTSMFQASAIAHHASKLQYNKRRKALRSFVRCARCPAAAPPRLTGRGVGIEPQILDVLAGRNDAMSVGEILDSGIKGLTKNNVAKIMKALVDSGLVLLTNRGPAKFFEVP